MNRRCSIVAYLASTWIPESMLSPTYLCDSYLPFVLLASSSQPFDLSLQRAEGISSHTHVMEHE